MSRRDIAFLICAVVAALVVGFIIVGLVTDWVLTGIIVGGIALSLAFTWALDVLCTDGDI